MEKPPQQPPRASRRKRRGVLGALPWLGFALGCLLLVDALFELRRLDTPHHGSADTSWFPVIRGETCSHRRIDPFVALQGWQVDTHGTHSREKQVYRIEYGGLALEGTDLDRVFEVFLQGRLLPLRPWEAFGLRLLEEGTRAGAAWELGFTILEGRQGDDVWYFAAETPFPCGSDASAPTAPPALTDALASARTPEDLKEKLVRELNRQMLARVD